MILSLRADSIPFMPGMVEFQDREIWQQLSCHVHRHDCTLLVQSVERASAVAMVSERLKAASLLQTTGLKKKPVS
jgi:hypothetical protein